MIQSKEDLKKYIRQDRLMNGIPEETSLAYKIARFFVPDLTIKYLCYLRKEEFYTNRGGIFYVKFYVSYICTKKER